MEDESIFEAEVLRTARALFSEAPLAEGSSFISGTERDGVFITADAVTIVEATVSRRLDKAKKDGQKIAQACIASAKKYPFKSVKGYFVTLNEPTADQRTFIQSLKAPVIACSHAQLRALLIDSREYLTSRRMYPFGSARHPGSGDHRNLDDYISLGFRDSGSGRIYSLTDMSKEVMNGRVVALIGDFGAGKSMTFRELHRLLEKDHLRGAVRFPVALNLRDHRGQVDPDEALERHGRRVGFEQRSRLVRAWLAGDVSLLLDGFDEIATPGWLGRATELRDIRRRSVELVRRFMEMRPRNAGVLITGRSHFFDSLDELRSALGLPPDALLLSVDDFSDDQMSEYLQNHGWEARVPDWLPARPLLLGYLAANRLLDAAVATGDVSAAPGWDGLLDRICEREANIEVGVDGTLVRRIFERLATMARGRPNGVGPLWPDDLMTAYQQVSNQRPDEGSYQLLQRMPGLGTQDAAEGSRYLIDSTMADAARAGDVRRYAESPHSEQWMTANRLPLEPMDELGVEVAAVQFSRVAGTASRALAAAAQSQKDGGSDSLAFDLLRIAMYMSDTVKAPSLGISGISILTLEIGEGGHELESVTFANCVVERLDISDYAGDSPLPRFDKCIFGVVVGVGSAQALPTERFTDCEFEQFDISTRTTKGILTLSNLSSRQRVALTILKKLYAQRGTGRKEMALYRGLDERHRGLVPEVLQILESEGFAAKSKFSGTPHYLPTKGRGVRVRQLLESGGAVSDSLMRRLA